LLYRLVVGGSGRKAPSLPARILGRMSPEQRDKLVSDIRKSVKMREAVIEELLAGADVREFFPAWRLVEECDLNIGRQVRILRPH
jgi:hypothetical protein